MVGSMKALLVVDGPEGLAVREEIELPDAVAERLNSLPGKTVMLGSSEELAKDAAGRILAAADGLSPEIQRDARIAAAVISEYHDAGAHLIYSLYRQAGGCMSWKTFRRAIGKLRGDDRPIATASQEMMARRRQKVFEEVEAKAEAKAKAAQARAERAKEREAMTIRREDLRRGQHVYVRVRYGDQMKLKPAKINEVMRAAVNLTIEGEHAPLTVRFNEIELSLDSTEKKPLTAPTLAAVPQAFAALGDGRGVQSVAPERRHPHVEVRRPLAPPPEPSPPESDARPPVIDQVSAWIEQGASMRDGLAKQREKIEAEMDALAAEALKIEEAINAKKAEHARVDTLLKALDQMRGTVAA